MAKNILSITVMRLSGGWAKSMPGYSRNIKEWCRATLSPTPTLPRKHGREASAKRERVGITVVLADDAMLKRLNRTYRGKDKPTNVLSFAGEGRELGDVVLAYETVKREAGEQGKGFAQHAAHLVVHGCLHLLGYDHERVREASRMEKLEKSILVRFGFPDPYIIATCTP